MGISFPTIVLSTITTRHLRTLSIVLVDLL